MVKGEMLEIDVSSIFPAGMFPGVDYASLVFRPKNKANYAKVVGLRFQYEGPTGPQGPPGPAGPSSVYKSGVLDLFTGTAKVLTCQQGDKLILYGFDPCPFGYILIRGNVNLNGVDQAWFACSILGIIDELKPGGGWGLCMDF